MKDKLPWDLYWNFGPLLLFFGAFLLLLFAGWQSEGWGWLLLFGILFWRSPSGDDNEKVDS